MNFENSWNVYTVAFIAENAIFINGNNDCLYPGHGFFQNRMRDSCGGISSYTWN